MCFVGNDDVGWCVVKYFLCQLVVFGVDLVFGDVGVDGDEIVIGQWYVMDIECFVVWVGMFQMMGGQWGGVGYQCCY